MGGLFDSGCARLCIHAKRAPAGGNTQPPDHACAGLWPTGKRHALRKKAYPTPAGRMDIWCKLQAPCASAASAPAWHAACLIADMTPASANCVTNCLAPAGPASAPVNGTYLTPLFD